MATSHGSPPKIKELQDRFKCLEKAGPDGRRQPWGPTLQTMNLQVRNCREAPPPSKANANQRESNGQQPNN